MFIMSPRMLCMAQFASPRVRWWMCSALCGKTLSDKLKYAPMMAPGLLRFERILFLLVLAGTFYSGVLRAQDSLLSKSDLIALDFKVLGMKKKAIASGAGNLMPAYEQLLVDAD